MQPDTVAKKNLLELVFVAIPKITGGLATIVLNGVLLHFLGPDAFGVYSLCIFGILMADAVIGSAVDLGVLRLSPLYLRDEPQYSLCIEKSAFRLKLMAGGLVGLVLIFFSVPLARVVFHQDHSAHLIWLSCTAALGMLLLRSAQVHFQVKRQFLLYGSLDLLLNFVRFGGILVVGLAFRITPESVLLFYALGPLVAFGACLPWIGRDLAAPGGSRSREATAELLRYVKWFLLTFSVGAVVNRTDLYLLTAISSISEVGVFSGGLTYALIPELLGTYMAVVFGPRIMPRFRDGTFFEWFRKVQGVCIVLAAGLFVAGLAVVNSAGALLLPDSFSRSAGIFLVLLPGTLAGMVNFPITLSFLMFVRPSFWVTMELLTLPLLVACYIYFIGKYGSMGAAWTSSLFRVFKVIVGQAMAYRWARQSAGQATGQPGNAPSGN